jgi:5'-3' exonuclease
MNVLFIDTSYFVFYRYYATLGWIRRSKNDEEIDIHTLMDNPTFLNMFTKKFEQSILKIIKTHKIQQNHVFLVQDCYRDQIWRMQHYTNYKQNREERLKTFNPQIFKHLYNHVLPSLQAKHGFRLLSHPRAEADDIIAVLHKHFRVSHPECNVFVVTNDNDLLQLLDDHTHIFNLARKDLADRLPCDRELFCLTKILMGDKSDNIAPVFPKCGLKTALKLAQSPDMLKTKLDEKGVFRQRFETNSKLIDFNCIPEDIRTDIQNLITT